MTTKPFIPWVAALLSLTAGCSGGGKKSGCGSGGSGTIQFSTTDLPAGTFGAYLVDGVAVAGTSGAATASGGTHSVSVANVADRQARVRNVYQGTPDRTSVCVKNAQTSSVHVTYAPIASSGKLWQSNDNGSAQFSSYAAAVLDSSGTLTPASGNTGSLTAEVGVAFDRDGNLWIADSSGFLKRYPAGALGASGAVTPDVVITGGALTAGVPGPVAIAFDANGNLWASCVAADKVVKYDAADLLASGSPTASVEIGAGTSGLNGPAGIAFDGAGNLWVASALGVSRWNAARLGTTDTLPPDLTITARSGPPAPADLTGATGLAFDAAGSLWVSYFNPNVIAEITSADLGATGATTITPANQLTLNVTALLAGIAFDDAGALWTPYSTGKFARLDPAQLGLGRTTVTPAAIMTTPVGDVDWLAIFPATAGSPLYDAYP